MLNSSLEMSSLSWGWVYLDYKGLILNLSFPVRLLILAVLVIVVVGVFSRARAVLRGEGATFDIIVVSLGLVAAAIAVFLGLTGRL